MSAPGSSSPRATPTRCAPRSHRLHDDPALRRGWARTPATAVAAYTPRRLGGGHVPRARRRERAASVNSPMRRTIFLALLAALLLAPAAHAARPDRDPARLRGRRRAPGQLLRRPSCARRATTCRPTSTSTPTAATCSRARSPQGHRDVQRRRADGGGGTPAAAPAATAAAPAAAATRRRRRQPDATPERTRRRGPRRARAHPQDWAGRRRGRDAAASRSRSTAQAGLARRVAARAPTSAATACPATMIAVLALLARRARRARACP